MISTVEFLEKLSRKIQAQPLLAVQNLDTTNYEPGLLCRVKNFKQFPFFFYLITEIHGDSCEVIPGSLESIMAGPLDIVLPPQVLGDMFFLSLDLAATIPISELGSGFALLDTDTYNRIIDSQLKFDTDEDGDFPSFPFAQPFVNKDDSRVAYHTQLQKVVQEAQKTIFSSVFSEEDAPENLNILQPLWSVEQVSSLAAGAEETYSAFFVVDNADALLLCGIEEHQLKITVYTADKNDFSSALDQWHLVSSEGTTLGTIQNGMCVVDNFSDPSMPVGLVDLQCGIHPLKKEQK